jgi:hypothetical protein
MFPSNLISGQRTQTCKISLNFWYKLLSANSKYSAGLDGRCSFRKSFSLHRAIVDNSSKRRIRKKLLRFKFSTIFLWKKRRWLEVEMDDFSLESIKGTISQLTVKKRLIDRVNDGDDLINRRKLWADGATSVKELKYLDALV